MIASVIGCANGYCFQCAYISMFNCKVSAYSMLAPQEPRFPVTISIS